MSSVSSQYRFIFIVVFIIIVAFFIPSYYSVHALTISPARVEFKTDPGTRIDSKFTLINEQEEAKTFYISYENFDAKGETGTPNFINDHTGLANWISSPLSSVTLNGKESRNYTFSITVPKNAEPGGYFSAIFLSTVPPSTSEEGAQVSIGAKVGMLILLTVNGDINEDGGITEFDTVQNRRFYTSLPVDMTYRFRNDGNDRIQPKGDIVIKNMVGIKSARINANIAEGNILPKSARRFNVTWAKRDKETVINDTGSFIHRLKRSVNIEWHNFAFGRYSANLNLEYGTHGQSATATTHFFVLPWHLLLIVLILLIIIVFGMKHALRAYNRSLMKKLERQMGIENVRSFVAQSRNGHENSENDNDVRKLVPNVHHAVQPPPHRPPKRHANS